jgi:hypothetical protein
MQQAAKILWEHAGIAGQNARKKTPAYADSATGTLRDTTLCIKTLEMKHTFVISEYNRAPVQCCTSMPSLPRI